MEPIFIDFRKSEEAIQFKEKQSNHIVRNDSLSFESNFKYGYTNGVGYAINGKKTGPWKFYDELNDNSLIWEITFEKDIMNGTFIQYHQSNAVPELVFNTKNGTLIKKTLNYNLKIFRKGEYLDGKQHGIWMIDNGVSGKNETTYEYGIKNGPWRHYDKYEGQLDIEGYYLNDEKHGIWKEYNTDFNPPLLEREEEYFNGIKHGFSKEYDRGQLWYHEIYKDGKRDGPSIRYHEGNIDCISIYKNGEIVSRHDYDDKTTNGEK